VRKRFVILVILFSTSALLAWSPWITEEYAINKVINHLGGPDTEYVYLGENMTLSEIPKNAVKVPFVTLVYFPGEAMYIVTFFGIVI